MSLHKRVNVDQRGKDYGYCIEHPTRKNEFYCYCCQNAYCSECILTGLTKNDGKNHNLINIEIAYNNALNEAKNNDVALEDKKALIHDQINLIQDKLRSVRSNAENIQTQITKILEDCMNQLMVEVQKKSSILKSDKVELSRQFKEIEFMTEFLKRQAEETAPIEFMQLYAGHNQIKNNIYKQRTTVSDIQVDMKHNGKPMIHVDQSVKSVDIQNMNIDKQHIMDKAKNSMEK